MSKKGLKVGIASAAVIGAGAAVLQAKNKSEAKKAAEKTTVTSEPKNDYRNTERGKDRKNSKGIYYTNGNYEAFARPEKPEGVDEKSAYLVGSGLAALAAACFLVRDGQMKGDHIHILEAMDIAGGACDGIYDPTRGYIMRGGREMENHFECLWDLFHSIPSIETPGVSVLDEYYWLNKKDPNYSLCRATKNRGEDAHTDGKFNLSQKGCMEIMKLFMTRDEDLYDKTIEDVFDDEVFNSTFWLYWRTMFAFENWHSALEMKLYFQRFIHHIGGLPDFSALKFTKYNQYESLILPMKKYLEDAGVDFQFNTEVTNVIFEINDGKKVAKAIECKVNGVEKGIVLTENDLVFVTNGSCTEGTIYGDQNHAPNGDAEVRTSGCWSLWKNIAKQDPSFGHPEKFCSDIAKTNWESATITTLDNKIIPYITNICKRDPRTGKVVTGGIVSCRFQVLLSWTSTVRDSSKSRIKSMAVSIVTVSGTLSVKAGSTKAYVGKNERRVDRLLGPGLGIRQDTDLGHFTARASRRRYGNNGQRLAIRPSEQLFIIQLIRADQGDGLSRIHRRTAANTDDEIDTLFRSKGSGLANRRHRRIIFDLIKKEPGNPQFIQLFHDSRLRTIDLGRMTACDQQRFPSQVSQHLTGLGHAGLSKKYLRRHIIRKHEDSPFTAQTV